VAGQRGKAGLEDGPPGESCLRQPSAIALDADGLGLIVCDDGNNALRRLDIATHELRTLQGNSAERIRKTWMPPGYGLAPSMWCPGGSVSVVKTDKEAVWSTAFAPLSAALPAVCPSLHSHAVA
jgi:hypothetical protein